MGFLRSSIFLFLGNVSIAISSLLLGIITARILEPTGRGELYLALQIINVGSIYLSLGIAPAYQYFISKKIITESKIISHIIYQIILVSIILVFLYLFSPVILNNFELNSINVNLIFFCVIGVLINIVNLFSTSVILTKNNGIPFHSVLSIIGSFFNLFLIVLFTYFDSLDFETAVYSYFGGLLVQIIPKIYKVLSTVNITLQLKWFFVTKKLIKYAVPSFLTNIGLILVFKIDTFIISEILDIKALGLYSMSVAFAEITLMIPNSVGTVLFTKLPTTGESEKIALLKKVNKILVFLSLSISIFLIFIGPFLINFLLGDLYIDSILPLQILAPGLIFMASNYVFTNYFSGSGQPNICAKVYGLGLLINIFFNFYLIKIWGINGAAFASTITYFSISMMFWILLREKLKISFKDTFIVNMSDIKDFILQISSLIKSQKNI